MLVITGYDIREKIYTGKRSLIYRAVKSGYPVIIKTLYNEYPDFTEMSALKLEYRTLKEIQATGIVRVLGFELYKNSGAIVFEDIGGETLDGILQEIRKLSLGEILDLMIKAAKALGEINKYHIIHKDIKLSNIIVNMKTGELQIIDFGKASMLGKQNSYIPLNNSIIRTLAYISPEQTGRMNRTVDYRTDYYSLGVTFYQLLTGELPFDTTDPMELVHAHIAKTPVSPSEKNNTPKILSNIVMKLLSKNPEDRYQSMAGLLYDLEWYVSAAFAGASNRSLEEMRSLSGVEMLIGAHDFSGKFQIPEKLYGRTREVIQIVKVFKKVAEGVMANQETPLLLISGRSGIGKSALIKEVNKPIVEYKGFFASGKYDQFKRTIPYNGITQVFQNLIQQILASNPEDIQVWKDILMGSLGANGKLLIDVIPDLEVLIGKQPDVSELGATESQNRFNLVFQNFIKTFCRKELPITIFLDDMQWADTPSIHLIHAIATNSEMKYLLIILSFRDNEVFATDTFSIMLGDLKKSGFIYKEILLNPILVSDINHLVSDTLTCEQEKSRELATILFNKTKGNPFFVNEMFKSLYDKNLISQEGGVWNWDTSKINAVKISENVIDLLVEKIRVLSLGHIEILKVSACIGNSFELSIISALMKMPYEEINTEIGKISNEGFLLVGDNTVQFVHDKVQEATYLFLSADERAKNHYAIGKLYLENTSESDLDDKVFTIVNQLNLGIVHVVNVEERKRLQELNFLAGKKALASNAYEAALSFFKVAKDFLPKKNSWNEDYERTLLLTTKLAEAEYLNGNFEASEELIHIILEHAKTGVEKADVYKLLIIQYTLSAKYTEAILVLRKVMIILNLELPTEDHYQEVIKNEMLLIKATLLNKKVGALANEPEIKDPEKKIAINLLTISMPTSYYSSPELWTVLVLKTVNLYLKYGNVGETYGYSCYGILLAAYGDFKSGYEFGKLAVTISKTFNNKSEKCKGSNVFANLIHSWVYHLKHTVEINADGFNAGLESGEFQHASYTLMNASVNLFFMGKNLAQIQSDIGKMLQFTQKVKSNVASDMILGVQLISKSLQSSIETKFNYSSEDENYLNVCKSNQSMMSICIYKVMKSQILFLYSETQQAYAEISESAAMLSFIVGLHPVAEYNFYYSLILAALYDEASHDDRLIYLEQIKTNQKQMKIWSESCTENFLHKYLLVEAELARIEGNNWYAVKLYDESIQEARQNEFIQNEAIANELAAKFWLKNKERFGQNYLVDSYRCYEAWGAVRKCEIMLEIYPQLKRQIMDHHSDMIVRSDENGSLEIATVNAGDFLDLNTVIKASQAISGEIQLGKLLEKMMLILFENAGAERGVFILKENDKWTIEANGNANTGSISVLQALPLDGNSELSTSIVNYVIQTQNIVLLNDALKKGMFVNDSYVKSNSPKSILCYPIINQGNLIGVVYLENNLTTDAFTSERLEILKVLSSQIAVSLENSLLYANMEDKVKERTSDLRQALVEVRALKQQQDGDYFLNTLLIEPLTQNNAISQFLEIEFFIKQSKNFLFRKKEYELGGDINISENIELYGKKYVVVVNADAMGKSIQGSSGVLVFGTVFKSIIQRTNAKVFEKNVHPEIWLKKVFIEIHKVFESFDGFMLMSMVLGLIDEVTGTMYYINVEHPKIVLYRDTIVSFIEHRNQYSKLGTMGQTGNISVEIFRLISDDIIIFGSDGRDDLILGIDPETNYNIINFDQNLFLTYVKKADGDLEKIYKEILGTGKPMDDLSMLKIHYKGKPIDLKKQELGTVLLEED